MSFACRYGWSPHGPTDTPPGPPCVFSEPLYSNPMTPAPLGNDTRSATAHEWVEHDPARRAEVLDPEQRDGLGECRRMPFCLKASVPCDQGVHRRCSTTIDPDHRTIDRIPRRRCVSCVLQSSTTVEIYQSLRAFSILPQDRSLIPVAVGWANPDAPLYGIPHQSRAGMRQRNACGLHPVGVLHEIQTCRKDVKHKLIRPWCGTSNPPRIRADDEDHRPVGHQ